jgi:hypothetical protein
MHAYACGVVSGDRRRTVSLIEIKNAANGEIRKNCRVVN